MPNVLINDIEENLKSTEVIAIKKKKKSK